jgi:hypothetical protein
MGRSLKGALVVLWTVCDVSLAIERRAAPPCRTCNASAANESLIIAAGSL